MIYTIHRRRILAVGVFVSFGVFVTNLVHLEEPLAENDYADLEDLRHQYSPVKRTRVVHAVDEIAVPPARYLFVSSSRDISFRRDNAAGEDRVRSSGGKGPDARRVEGQRSDPRISQSHLEGSEDANVSDYSEEYYGDEDIIDDDDDVYETDDVEEEYDVFEEGDFDDADQSFASSREDRVNRKNGAQQAETKSSLIEMLANRTLSDADGANESQVGRTPASRRTQQRVEPFATEATPTTLSSLNTQSSISGMKFEVPIHRRHSFVGRNVSMVTKKGIPIVEDTIYWSRELEGNSPPGVRDEEVNKILHQLRHLRVQKVQPPTWNRCGRPKNQFVIFEDGSKACARYRTPHEYLVQGEVMSFYLSRLLSITNVPVVALSAAISGPQWSEMEVQSGLQKSEWVTNATVALIQWIDNLERDRMPSLLLLAMMNKTVLSARTSQLTTLSTQKLVELLQWSDLIVFDYITGNYDRVASMQDAADKEKKPSILHETIHNLVRSHTTGGLWLIDNESGLLDSYSLLYGRPGHDGRFLAFHKEMLDSVCLFRRSTVERVQWLHRRRKAGQILMELVHKHEPLFPALRDHETLERRLQERIGEVYARIERCAQVY